MQKAGITAWQVVSGNHQTQLLAASSNLQDLHLPVSRQRLMPGPHTPNIRLRLSHILRTALPPCLLQPPHPPSHRHPCSRAQYANLSIHVNTRQLHTAAA